MIKIEFPISIEAWAATAIAQDVKHVVECMTDIKTGRVTLRHEEGKSTIRIECDELP